MNAKQWYQRRYMGQFVDSDEPGYVSHITFINTFTYKFNPTFLLILQPRLGKKMHSSKHLTSISLSQLALCFFFLLFTVAAQSLPPARSDGFIYAKRRIDSDTIIIEAFFDPVCPYSRDAWPPLKQALRYYGHRAWLTVHLLPLPYHDNAFATSRAVHIVNNLNSSSTFRILEAFFHHQEKFYGYRTENLTKAAIVNEIVNYASSAVGKSYKSGIESGFNDRATNLQTRVSFKYAASRGVSGTPSFYVNGFVLPDSPSDFKGWRRIIDPLINSQKA